jgi:hypothetical protein
MTNPSNPLRRHFRQPAIYVKLPSDGNYYPPGALAMPDNRELAVLPMTAVDEITSRTPDALFNGSAVMEIINSCIPAIKNPWAMPVIDLNTVLVAMRVASYGHSMDIESTCPSCRHNNEFTVDLRSVLDRLDQPDYTKTLVVGDLEFVFRPLTYKEVNQNNQLQFEDQKFMQVLSNTEMPEQEKMKILGDSFRKITELSIQSLGLSISQIKTPDAIVTDYNDINEFLHNCDKKMFEQVRDRIIELKNKSDIPPLDLACTECSHKYTQQFGLDMSNFFEANS